MRLIRFAASLSALSMAIAGASVAHADSPDQGSDATSSATAQQAYQAVERADRKWTDAAADVPANASGKDAIKTKQQGVGISVPNDPSSKMTIAGRNGKVSVDLPFSGSASKAASSQAGTATFDNKNGSSTTPIVRKDGSAQINIVIKDAKAPKRYAYKIQVPEGAKIQRAGSSVLVKKGKKMVVGIAPAWAKDAKGKSVPTHYEVKGNTVTQVVDHGSQYAYPIVADPWLGIDLFGTLEKDRPGTDRNHGTVYSGMLSDFGWALYLGTGVQAPLFPLNPVGPGQAATGNLIIRYAGWEEWKDRFFNSREPSSPSLYQQYSCHVAYGYAIFGAGFHWDIESNRPSNPDWWKQDVREHKCNW